ncbi:hypothetical protein V6V47_31525 [Micromonospora sp. CPCC 205539]|uniref:hypothetical protein n=1 Tax=Micromonospora sp. CPCC 205539 TaxID=3122408 RepID=UPI002FF24E62
MATRTGVARWAGRAATIAALTGVSLAATTTAAQAVDEWYEVGAKSGTCRLAQSLIYGAYGDTEICWRGTEVWVRGFIQDTAPDGYRAVLQIRYNVDGDTELHYRNYLSDTNSADGGTSAASWSKARYPTRNLTARACTYDGSTKKACDATWR